MSPLNRRGFLARLAAIPIAAAMAARVTLAAPLFQADDDTAWVQAAIDRGDIISDRQICITPPLHLRNGGGLLYCVVRHQRNSFPLVIWNYKRPGYMNYCDWSVL